MASAMRSSWWRLRFIKNREAPKLSSHYSLMSFFAVTFTQHYASLHFQSLIEGELKLFILPGLADVAENVPIAECLRDHTHVGITGQQIFMQ